MNQDPKTQKPDKDPVQPTTTPNQEEADKEPGAPKSVEVEVGLGKDILYL